ncbi:hypothetical protein J3459_018213 [Metarhizium acridum]|nr:hypothetical protein J3459_018213 [Metarhizium acridum]
MLETLILFICGLLINMLIGFLMGFFFPLLPTANALALSSNGTAVLAHDALSAYSGTIQSAFASLPQGESERKTHTNFNETDWAEWCHHMAQRSSHTEEVQHICETRTLPVPDLNKRGSCSYNPLIIRRAVTGAVAVVAALYECQTLADNFANSCLAQPDDNTRGKFLRGYDCLKYGGALLIGFTTASTIQYTGAIYAETIGAWAHTIMGNWLAPPEGQNPVKRDCGWQYEYPGTEAKLRFFGSYGLKVSCEGPCKEPHYWRGARSDSIAAMLGQLSWEAGYYPEQVLWSKDGNDEMVSACHLTLESEGFGSCPEVKRGDCA